MDTRLRHSEGSPSPAPPTAPAAARPPAGLPRLVDGLGEELAAGGWSYPWRLGPGLEAPARPSSRRLAWSFAAMIEGPCRDALLLAESPRALLIGAADGHLAHRLLDWGAESVVASESRERERRRATLIARQLRVPPSRLEIVPGVGAAGADFPGAGFAVVLLAPGAVETGVARGGLRGDGGGVRDRNRRAGDDRGGRARAGGRALADRDRRGPAACASAIRSRRARGARRQAGRLAVSGDRLSGGLPAGEDGEGLLWAERDAAYRWAAGAVRGRDVLVIGSERGHGAATLLGAGARTVVGVDPDERECDLAMAAYGESIRFLRAEPVALPLASASFDLVTCFGALERSLDPDAAIAEIKRVLTADGIGLLALPLEDPDVPGEIAAPGRPREAWEAALRESFPSVALSRLRVSLAAAVAPLGSAPASLGVTWATADDHEDRAMLAVVANGELPELAATATLVGIRDLRAQEEALAAWELRARRAEADGAAKHWEMVAAREAQRRLRKRLHELEHRPLRMLSRIVRGKPRKLNIGPPIRASERKPDRWE